MGALVLFYANYLGFPSFRQTQVCRFLNPQSSQDPQQFLCSFFGQSEAYHNEATCEVWGCWMMLGSEQQFSGESGDEGRILMKHFQRCPQDVTWFIKSNWLGKLSDAKSCRNRVGFSHPPGSLLWGQPGPTNLGWMLMVCLQDVFLWCFRSYFFFQEITSQLFQLRDFLPNDFHMGLGLQRCSQTGLRNLDGSWVSHDGELRGQVHGEHGRGPCGSSFSRYFTIVLGCPHQYGTVWWYGGWLRNPAPVDRW